MKDLTTIDYWIKAQGKLDITLNKNNIIENWINSCLESTEIKTSIEIGCYPGKFLTILGEKGVEVNGIDFIPAVVELEEVFKKKGYNVGEFINTEFTKFKTSKRYDCVMSFGFIEHFSNWEEIIIMHLNLVSDNGYIIIEVPNFRGFFQKLPRFIFDYENYKRHNIDSMNIEKWNAILENNDFEIISSTYFGGYDLWFENNSRNPVLIKIRNFFVRVLRIIKGKIHPNSQEHSSFSCVMGIIAKRK